LPSKVTVELDYAEALRVVVRARRQSIGLSARQLGTEHLEDGSSGCSVERLALLARQLNTSPAALMRRAEALMGWDSRLRKGGV